MTVTVELEPEHFERIASGEERNVEGILEAVVIRQGEGLFEERRTPGIVDMLFSDKRRTASGGPVIRVWLQAREEVQDGGGRDQRAEPAGSA